MRLVSVAVENFKSLERLTLAVGRFTVITGPNGAGKSNLVDAVNFLGEIYSLGLEQAIVKNGGLANMARVRPEGTELRVKFVVRASLGGEDVAFFTSNSPIGPWSSNQIEEFGMTYEHQFVVAAVDSSVGADFRIETDKIRFESTEGKTLVELGYDVMAGPDSDVQHTHFGSRLQHQRMLRDILGPLADKNFREYAPPRANLRSSLLVESLNVGQAMPYLKQGLGGIRLYQLSPYQCRQASVATPNAILDRYGENLPAAALHLSRNDPEGWALVVSGMESILPELERIQFTPTQDRKLALEFKENKTSRAWSSAEVSDGTIQAFALLVALYDKRAPVLMVEEPENSVHPWILRQFIDLCREVPGRQIVLTTHSPVVLNYVPSGSVYLMTQTRSGSHIGELVESAGEARELVEDGELAIFDVYDSGIIDTSVPGGLSKGG